MHMLDDHENDASWRYMIAMLVSDPEGYTKNSQGKRSRLTIKANRTKSQ